MQYFTDILDSVKNFSLPSQYKDNAIILLVERSNDMKLSYQLFADKFQDSREGFFVLPRVKKVLTQSVDNENGEYFHQGKNLKTFNKEKDSIKNVVPYVSSYHFVFGRVWRERRNRY